MWTVIAQFICIAAACGLLAIVFDMDHETPFYVRWPIIGLCVIFAIVAGASYQNPEFYERAAAIALTSIGILVVGIVLYLFITKQINPKAIRIAWGALGVVALLWVVGSCSDIRRQKMQIQKANADTLVSVLDKTY